MNQAKDNLRKMAGKIWLHKGRHLFFEGIEVIDDKVKLLTDSGDITFTNSSMIHFFIEDCKPVALAPAPEVPSPDPVMAELKGVLLENIKKLREDSRYIPQAQAISKQVQTLINLRNLEINVKKISER